MTAAHGTIFTAGAERPSEDGVVERPSEDGVVQANYYWRDECMSYNTRIEEGGDYHGE